ncbi:arylamine N-acetyltransferase [Nocardioides sp. MAH-18]|uniref:Arylamine N-acetyltransferase n=1 Tax=Nocardioides agri TaxID=2682843 RepID=A0A6L6XMY0_9ACTN|nr:MULTISPECIES: arylamine N-acetyltransferase [unclassified Nocardioides]MBA2953553.1 arylamine N-acetyltransferase [Nocardioides sp. CGMCC 1.13656]MVQ48420.1 arylamine N-acetyltransferase [Nocardioides sp. MAH-18]
MSTTDWQTDRLDLAGYLARIGVPAREAGRSALDELHEAHVQAFTFDNIDVLLGQHPGVSLDAVQDKFVGRGRGGYCFEHSTVFAAALERLGYDVRRHLGRVGDPATGQQQGRTHMVVEVVLDGQRLLCDPGFGMSLLRPIPLADGAEDDYLPGWRYRIARHAEGWVLGRLRESGWEVAHTTDELPVKPVDVVMGHHYTSTHPASHFTFSLTVAKHLDGQHVTVTHETLTIRTPGETPEHRPLRDGELDEWLTALGVPLTDDERARLLALAAALPPRT